MVDMSILPMLYKPTYNEGCTTMDLSDFASVCTWWRLNEALPVAGVALAAARPEVPRQAAVAHAAALPSRQGHRKTRNEGRPAMFLADG